MGQSVGQRVLDRFASRGAADRAPDAEQRGSRETDRGDGSDSRHEEPGDERPEKVARRGPRGSPHDSADRSRRSRLLRIAQRHLPDFAFPFPRREDVDALRWSSGGDQAFDRAAGVVLGRKDSDSCFHVVMLLPGAFSSTCCAIPAGIYSG